MLQNFNTPPTPSNGYTDTVMTKELVDSVIASKLQKQGEATARKEATHVADKAEAAEMMAEIAVRDAMSDIQPDDPQQ